MDFIMNKLPVQKTVNNFGGETSALTKRFAFFAGGGWGASLFNTMSLDLLLRGLYGADIWIYTSYREHAKSA